MTKEEEEEEEEEEEGKIRERMTVTEEKEDELGEMVGEKIEGRGIRRTRL